MHKAKALVLAALLASAVITAGCIFPENGGEEPETEYRLSFVFKEGSALFHRVKLSLEVEGQEKQEQVMETISYVSGTTDQYSEIEITMLDAYALVNGEKEPLCQWLPLYGKNSIRRFYPDGRVGDDENTFTTFHLPEESKKVGDTWEFEGIEYKVGGEEQYSNQAGDFTVLRISFDGLLSDNLGTKRVYGYFLYDFEKKLKVMERSVNEWPSITRISENELYRYEENFSGEVDLSCVLAERPLSLQEKFELADYLFADNNFNESLSLALEVKLGLEEKPELSAEEIVMYKDTLVLVADNYKWLKDAESEMGQRYEAAEYFSQFLLGDRISIKDFGQAFNDYQLVAASGHAFAGQAAQKLADLNARIAGFLKGNASLMDTGKTEGLEITLSEGSLELEFEAASFATGYSIPIVDLPEGGQFAAVFTRPGYNPVALPPLEASGETFEGEYSVLLKRMDSNALGFLAGLCYSLDENGHISKFNDLNFFIESGSGQFEAECKVGFYRAELEPGSYTIPGQETAYKVEAAETTLAHLVQ